MTNVTIALILLFAFSIGVIVLQVFLSKKESKWFGLILPILSLCLSFIAVLGVASFSTTGNLSLQTLDENGVVIQEEVIESPDTTQSIQDTPSLVIQVGSVFLLYNIPTIVLLAIYFGCREKVKRKKALDKMSIQDLE